MLRLYADWLLRVTEKDLFLVNFLLHEAGVDLLVLSFDVVADLLLHELTCLRCPWAIGVVVKVHLTFV